MVSFDPSYSFDLPLCYFHYLGQVADLRDEQQQQIPRRLVAPKPQQEVEVVQPQPLLPRALPRPRYRQVHLRAVAELLRHGIVPRRPFDSHPVLGQQQPPLPQRQDLRRSPSLPLLQLWPAPVPAAAAAAAPPAPWPSQPFWPPTTSSGCPRRCPPHRGAAPTIPGRRWPPPFRPETPPGRPAPISGRPQPVAPHRPAPGAGTNSPPCSGRSHPPTLPGGR